MAVSDQFATIGKRVYRKKSLADGFCIFETVLEKYKHLPSGTIGIGPRAKWDQVPDSFSQPLGAVGCTIETTAAFRAFGGVFDGDLETLDRAIHKPNTA